MQPSKPLNLRSLVIKGALQLSTVWDLITTLLGILIILDSRNPVAISLAVIGTLIVVAFNFSTRPIWRQRQRYSAAGLPLLGLRLVWLMAIVMDWWTSLTCNAWFIGPQQPWGGIGLGELLGGLSLGQLILVMFITVVTGVSPMLMGYLRDQDLDSLLS